ncbi:MAG: hypothetical protein KKD48_00400, partial [Nanoarchaeota archaeon]|nr:hypothetical protein [Nanoarchaeota archaeon]
MEIKFEARHILFIILGVLLLGGDIYFFFRTRWFKPVLVISFVIMLLQFFIDFLQENKKQKEVELKFLEFVRALVETVKSGVSIP